MAVQKDNRLAWGITLLLFGFIFLLRQLQFIPAEIAKYAFDFKNFPLIIGAIFLLFHRNKGIGLVLLFVGIMLRLSEIIQLTKQVSDYVWPILLIVAGGILVFGVKKGK